MIPCPSCPRSFPTQASLDRHRAFEPECSTVEPVKYTPEELPQGSMGVHEPGSPEAIAAVERHELELAERQVRAARQAAELAFNEPEQRAARALEGIHYELHRLVNALTREPGPESRRESGSPAHGPGHRTGPSGSE